jgi:hypothetical protein
MSLQLFWYEYINTGRMFSISSQERSNRHNCNLDMKRNNVMKRPAVLGLQKLCKFCLNFRRNFHEF